VAGAAVLHVTVAARPELRHGDGPAAGQLERLLELLGDIPLAGACERHESDSGEV
jgi:hypothetical protein